MASLSPNRWPLASAVVVAVVVLAAGSVRFADDEIPISQQPNEAALPLLPSASPPSTVTSCWARAEGRLGAVRAALRLPRGAGVLTATSNAVLLLLALAIAAVTAVGTFAIPCAVPLLLIRDRLSWQLSLGLSSGYYPIAFVFVAMVASILNDRPAMKALVKTANALTIAMFWLVTLPSILVPLYLGGDQRPLYGSLIGLWITAILVGVFAYQIAPDGDD